MIKRITMKHKYAINLFINLSVLVFITLVLSTCEKPERDNPWDAMSKLAPGSWAPQNLEVERVDLTKAKLSWTYSDHNIEGFRVDRKKGDGEWLVAYNEVSKDVLSWTDEDIIPEHGLKYFTGYMLLQVLMFPAQQIWSLMLLFHRRRTFRFKSSQM